MQRIWKLASYKKSFRNYWLLVVMEPKSLSNQRLFDSDLQFIIESVQLMDDNKIFQSRLSYLSK